LRFPLNGTFKSWARVSRLRVDVFAPGAAAYASFRGDLRYRDIALAT
jgi:hypothetical protein